MKPRVACFGATAVDTSVRAVRPLERSTSNRVTRLGDFGGVARNLGAMLARLGCEVAFAGLGADGVLITDTAGTRMLPALVPRVVSVNGAGDALAAGTLLGLLRGQGIDDAVLLGSKAAAMVVQSDQLIPDGFNADTLDAWQ